MDWLSLAKLEPVEAPDEPLHIAGGVKDDFASRWLAVHASIERAEVGIRQLAMTISIQPIARIVQPWRSFHCDTGPLQGQRAKAPLLRASGLGETSSWRAAACGASCVAQSAETERSTIRASIWSTSITRSSPALLIAQFLAFSGLQY
jgi:hypothetical protein